MTVRKLDDFAALPCFLLLETLSCLYNCVQRIQEIWLAFCTSICEWVNSVFSYSSSNQRLENGFAPAAKDDSERLQNHSTSYQEDINTLVQGVEVDLSQAFRLNYPIDNHCGNTPLHFCLKNLGDRASRGIDSCKNLAQRIIRLLVSTNMSLDVEDKTGRTPLHVVVGGCVAGYDTDNNRSRMRIAKTLIAHGANLESVDKEGIPLLGTAFSSMKLTDLLLRKGASLGVFCQIDETVVSLRNFFEDPMARQNEDFDAMAQRFERERLQLLHESTDLVPALQGVVVDYLDGASVWSEALKLNRLIYSATRYMANGPRDLTHKEIKIIVEYTQDTPPANPEMQHYLDLINEHGWE